MKLTSFSLASEWIRGEGGEKNKIKIKTAFNSVPWDSENECHCYAEYVLVLPLRGIEGLIELDWNVTTRTMFFLSGV